MHFSTKSYLKSTRNHTAKHAQRTFNWYIIRENYKREKMALAISETLA